MLLLDIDIDNIFPFRFEFNFKIFKYLQHRGPIVNFVTGGGGGGGFDRGYAFQH